MFTIRVNERREKKLIDNRVGSNALWNMYNEILEQDKELERAVSEFCDRMNSVDDLHVDMREKYESLRGWSSLDDVLHRYMQEWEFRSELRFRIPYRDYVGEVSEKLEEDVRTFCNRMASAEDLLFEMRGKYKKLPEWSFLECVLERYMQDWEFRYDIPYPPYG